MFTWVLGGRPGNCCRWHRAEGRPKVGRALSCDGSPNGHKEGMDTRVGFFFIKRDRCSNLERDTTTFC